MKRNSILFFGALRTTRLGYSLLSKKKLEPKNGSLGWRTGPGNFS